MTTIKILGEDELKRSLNMLPYQLERRFILSSLRQAAGPVKKQAVSNAPKSEGRKTSGTLKSSIVVVDSKQDVPAVWIAPTRGKRVKHNAWYAHFQERGTKGFGKRKRRVTGVGVSLKSGNVYTKRVTTAWANKGAGLPAQKFLERAFEEKKDEALKNVKAILSKKVVTYLRKTVPRYYAQ